MVEIEIGTIQVDAELQQRDLDESTVNHYTALIQDGHEFPAVSVCEEATGKSQEKTRWLYDGFHRVEAAKRAGLSKIDAQIVQGTKRDALWLSFAANKDHGLPRKAGQTKAIIKRILQDPEWRNKPLAAVARHVGVSRQYVSRINAELNLSTSCGQKDLATMTLAELESEMEAFLADISKFRSHLRYGLTHKVWEGLNYSDWDTCLESLAGEIGVDEGWFKLLADDKYTDAELMFAWIGPEVWEWDETGEEVMEGDAQ